MELKRYAVFKGDRYYPCGGWNDLKGFYDNEGDAIAAVLSGDNYLPWGQVVDMTTRQVVWSRE